VLRIDALLTAAGAGLGTAFLQLFEDFMHGRSFPADLFAIAISPDPVGSNRR
jgi:hypothetical protein